MAYRLIPANVRERAIDTWVALGSVRGAARELGVPPCTLSRWLRSARNLDTLRRQRQASEERLQILQNRLLSEIVEKMLGGQRSASQIREFIEASDRARAEVREIERQRLERRWALQCPREAKGRGESRPGAALGRESADER